MMKKGTKAWRDELVQQFYGINVLTDKVENFHLSRDHTLSRWNDDDVLIKHYVMRGRQLEAELNVVFHLIDIVGIAAGARRRVQGAHRGA